MALFGKMSITEFNSIWLKMENDEELFTKIKKAYYFGIL